MFRHISLSGRMVLALMLVLASVVPGSLHASALDASDFAAGGHSHAVSSPSASGHTPDHHNLGHARADTGHATHSGASDDTTDQCCPASCSFALADFVAEDVDVLVPDTFEIEPMPAFVVTAVALPERPPRA